MSTKHYITGHYNIRKAFFLTLFVSLILFAKGQSYDTIRICDRVPNYYYGEEWVDHYSKKCYGDCDLRHCIWYGSNAYVITARFYNIDTSLKIIGIAAPVYINTSKYYVDSNRVPEYFYLYDLTDTGCTLVGEVRWDTATVKHQMEFVYGPTEMVPGGSNFPYHWDSILQPDTAKIYFPVYEAYFGKPITIFDSFYVAGSGYNNGLYGSGFSTFWMHPRTNYIRWINNLNLYGSCWGPSTFGNAHKDPLMGPNNNGELDPSQGDAFDHFGAQWGGFGCMFPIFDTTPPGTTPHNDSCRITTGLRIMDITDDVVLLNWNPANNNKWEISIFKGDTAIATPDSGNINLYYESFASFYYLDTAWYTTYIRTVCNGDLRSEWSEPVHFHFPPVDTTDINIPPLSTADRFTAVVPNPAHNTITVFSSFQLTDVNIFNLEGKSVARQNASGISTQMDISALPPATYIVRIKTKGGYATKKLVKK